MNYTYFDFLISFNSTSFQVPFQSPVCCRSFAWRIVKHTVRASPTDGLLSEMPLKTNRQAAQAFRHQRIAIG